MRNDIVLCYQTEDGLRPSHFRLSEFANSDGMAMVDSSVVQSLEITRISLGKQYGTEVQILISDGFRTVEDNKRLAARLGWVHDGGLVAFDSRHLAKYGGIAVDISARYRDGDEWVAVVQADLAATCRHHFSYVKADYSDGHVHADNR